MLRTIILSGFAVIGLVAMAAAGAISQTSSAEESFANELLSLVRAGNVAGVVDRTETFETICPTLVGLPGNVCEGQPTGARLQGYRGAPMFGGVESFGRAGFEAFVAERVAALGPGELTLYTIAWGGHLTSARTCPGCATAVVSTPANAAIPGGVATVLLLEFERIGGELRVTAVLGGLVDDLARPAIKGGRYGHLLFEPVGAPGPRPPVVGTGGGQSDLQPRGSTSTAVIAGAAAVVAAVSTLLVWRARRR
ncbi:MAG: hypothetical protein WHT63_04690 [Tepidiforma sp.]